MHPALSFTGRCLRRGWRVLDAGRRALLNLLLLLLLAALAWAAVRSGPPALEPKTALVLDLAGPVAEQRAGSARDSLLKRLRGEGGGPLRLRDLLAGIDAAAADPQITHAVLLLDELGAAGLPTLRELAAAIGRFKAAGKPVVAWGSGYDQRQYFLAAHASEVWLDPLGEVFVRGYGGLRSYYKALFDRIGVAVDVVRAGEFKNAGEPFTAAAPSRQTVEADTALYGSLWASWTGAVEATRQLPAGSIAQAIDSLPASLEAAGGDAARWALERRWVDRLATREQMRAALIERGARQVDRGVPTFRQVSLGAYLGRVPPKSGGDAVGVVVAEGPIGDGAAPPGRVGGRSTAELIRRARHDDRIKALVLRIDSPGGSVFGSELVRRELEAARKAGKPVVVSMGDVAASGGYWISLGADEVIADEATVTGSIGVVAMLPSAGGALERLGVHTEGVTTTWLGGAYDARRSVDPRFARLVQAGVERAYADFLQRAAAARRTTPERIDAVAQGRVWSGRDAAARGLVDRLGGLQDALQAAAARGGLKPGHRVEYLEGGRGRLVQWLDRIGVDAQSTFAGALLHAAVDEDEDGRGPEVDEAALRSLRSAGGAGPIGPDFGIVGSPSTAGVPTDLAWLVELATQRAPGAAQAHCLCTPP